MQGLAALSAVAGPQCVLFRRRVRVLRSRARSIALFVRGGGFLRLIFGIYFAADVSKC